MAPEYAGASAPCSPMHAWKRFHPDTNAPSSSSFAQDMLPRKRHSSDAHSSPVGQASPRFSYHERQAAPTSVYATSPLAPPSAVRSPRHTPPTRSPDPRWTSSPPLAMTARKTSTPLRSPLMMNRRRFSEQSFPSMTSTSSTPNFGTLIGSYEESLLSGRMSTLPSKPLTFDAELGVLGFGKCKATLRCPPHISAKFPAHFYDLDGASDKEGQVSPSSPYVGNIDVENYYVEQLLANELDRFHIPDKQHRHPAIHQTTFPGYRVPPKGQVQLIIKNPNLTAVKVFLVPYDLTDMPAGTKTFVRQKCHVTSPNPSSSPPAPSLQANQRPSKETLRYAVHLQFCAVPQSRGAAGFAGVDRLPKKNAKPEGQGVRIYLHKSIRVVFSARVPDKSEKISVTTETPRNGKGENLYSTYSGPGDEWKETRRTAKERYMASKALGARYERDDALFDISMANSDPNGERLGPEHMLSEADMHEEGQSSACAGIDIPTSKRMSSVRASNVTGRTEDHFDRDNTSMSTSALPTIGQRVRNDAVDHPHASSRSRSSTVSAIPENTHGDDHALLQQWHASLSSRNQQLRPTSPSAMRSRPTSPPTVAGSYAMTRTSSSGGSSMRAFLPLTPQRTGSPLPHSVPFHPGPTSTSAQSEALKEYASGTMAQPHLNAGTLREEANMMVRPSLLRRLSSQSSITGHTSSASSPSHHAGISSPTMHSTGTSIRWKQFPDQDEESMLR